jgi:hypothetical protein
LLYNATLYEGRIHMIGDIHKNDVGTVFERTIHDQSNVVVDISGATTKQLIFVKPNGAKLTKTAGFTTDGKDGKLRYSTVSGDLNLSGTWSVQAHIILTTGEWYSDSSTFVVNDNL